MIPKSVRKHFCQNPHYLHFNKNHEHHRKSSPVKIQFQKKTSLLIRGLVNTKATGKISTKLLIQKQLQAEFSTTGNISTFSLLTNWLLINYDFRSDPLFCTPNHLPINDLQINVQTAGNINAFLCP